jgi:hypothetical protein
MGINTDDNHERCPHFFNDQLGQGEAPPAFTNVIDPPSLTPAPSSNIR